jgi:tetratricopeptide (TPR) repeat protein
MVSAGAGGWAVWSLSVSGSRRAIGAETVGRAGLAALALALPVVFPNLAVAAGGSTDLIGALETIESESHSLCGVPHARRPLGEAIDALLAEMKAGGPAPRDGDFPVDRLNELVYRHLGIRVSRDVRDPCNLLPSAVLARKEGYCVGIAAIYLALAERLDLPIHAVAIPTHVYLRYDDGRSRIDIETLAMGAPVPEGLSELMQPGSPARQSAVPFPRDLDTSQFLAQVHNNLGVVHSERSDHARAAAEYRKATALDPQLSSAWYNWGNDLLVAGEHRAAIPKLDEAVRLYPADTWALNNRGRAHWALGMTTKARKDFEAAIAIDPGFRPARRNLRDLDAGRKPGEPGEPITIAPTSPAPSPGDPP